MKTQYMYACKMLAKSLKTMKNTQNIKNNYTKYSNITLGQTQYIVAEIEFEQEKNAQNDRKHWVLGRRGCRMVAKMCYQFVIRVI